MTVEDLLTRTFSEVTETTDYPSTPTATVVARSRAIRGARRRRVALVAAAAVVAVAGVSAAVSLQHDHDSPPQPAGPLGDLPQGAAPQVDYIDGDTFVGAAGQRFRSAALAHAAGAAAWQNGVLVASASTYRPRHPFPTISFVTSGSTSTVGCGMDSFAVPPDGGDPIYWLSSDCKIDGPGRLVQGDTSTNTPKGAIFSPVGQVAGGLVAFSSGSTLHLPSHSLVVPPGGKGLIPLPLAVPRGTTTDGNLVSGVSRDVTASVVVDATSGDVKWRARYWTLGRFSSSGTYVVGTQGVGQQTEGTVGDVIGIFDAATGHRLLEKALPGLTLDGMPVWEGDDSVLVVAEDREGQEALIRVDLKGDVTRATGVVQGTPRPAVGRPPLTVLRLADAP